MNPELFVNRDDTRAPKVPLRLRDFGRLMALVRPHRKTLAIGLVFTLFFATFHTVSISGAFPVFKILLEEEGLRAWADRIVAGERIGAELAVGPNADVIRVVKVHRNGTGSQAGLQAGDELVNPAIPDTPALLATLASAEPGAEVHVQLRRASELREMVLRPAQTERHLRVLRWGASMVPADTQEQKLKALMVVLAGLVVVAIVANIFRYYGEVLVATAVLRSLMDLRAVLYEHVLALPMSFFAGHPMADIVTRFVQDIQELQRGLITLFGKFIREPLRIVLLLGWALLVDWRITLVAMLVTPAVVAVFWAVGRKVKKSNKKLLQAYGYMIGTLTATLDNLRVVKAYTAEEQEQQRLDKVDRYMFRQQLKLAKLDAFTGPMLETLAVVVGSLVTIWLLSRVLNHELSLSRFVTLGIALSVLFDPLRKLSDVWVRIQRSLAAGERIFHVLDEPVETGRPPVSTHGLHPSSQRMQRPGFDEPLALQPLQRSIEVVGVSFTYPNAERPALRDVSLTIAAGETIALVGPNGSGKTTMVALLLRFFDPTSGEIRYDGVELRKADLRSLRKQFGLVTQDAVVFAGTPAENIIYGSDEANGLHSDETKAAGQPTPATPTYNGRVEDAARKAFADEFIRALPNGFEAQLAERGTSLSGGQRQRLAIARAVYRNAPILIFDEATSQIDSESELKIQTALKEFAKGRTTIIIAHRLSTIQFANRIVVMDAGRIIDQGPHAELYTRCQLYRTLCDTQLVSENR